MSSPEPELPPSAVPTRTPAMAWQTIEGETVLLNVDGEELLGLNEVGARIWELCDGEHSLSQIAAELVSAFAVDEPTALADARTFVQELLSLHALQLGDRISRPR